MIESEPRGRRFTASISGTAASPLGVADFYNHTLVMDIMELVKISMPSILVTLIVGLILWAITELTAIHMNGHAIFIISIISGIFTGLITCLGKN